MNVADDENAVASDLNELAQGVQNKTLPLLDKVKELMQMRVILERDWRKGGPQSKEASVSFESKSSDVDTILESYGAWIERNKETPLPELISIAEKEIPEWGTPKAKLIFLTRLRDDRSRRLNEEIPILRSIVSDLDASIHALTEIVKANEVKKGHRFGKLGRR
jgi:hypothetical protein